MAVLSKLLFGIAAAPFLIVGAGFLIGTLRSSLQGFGPEFEQESNEAFEGWFGGQPQWLKNMFDPINGYVDLTYRHPLFHLHVWTGFAWFALGPIQLMGPSLLGRDKHRQLGIVLLILLGLTMLVHQRSFVVPYHARDPALPGFFLPAGVFTLINVVCALAAIRRGDVTLHKQYMTRAWFGTFVPIVMARSVVALILPRFIKHPDDFPESLIPTMLWILSSVTQLSLTLYWDHASSPVLSFDE